MYKNLDLAGSVNFLFGSVNLNFLIFWVLIYHIIYNYRLSKELNKEQSKAMRNCLIAQKYQLLVTLVFLIAVSNT
jgi:uncharacterized membrane protein YesL